MKELLTPLLADRLAGILLGHVTRPYPHKLDHVLLGAEDDIRPERLHPVFHGSFDWHSCVHGYWSLARLLRFFPVAPFAKAVADLFDSMLVPAKVASEVAYFEHPASRGFERPYGWAWLLKLAAELGRQPDRPWAAHLMPLTVLIRQRFEAYLPLATYPVRAGTHSNTAFALLLAADDASASGKPAFLSTLEHQARRWYGEDRDCQAWEPSSEDFLSPALVEAACMARLLPRDNFQTWFDAFLPRLVGSDPATLFRPVTPTDRSDGKLSHLDGLNLSRAWCFRLVADALDAGVPRGPLLCNAATAHCAAALPHVSGDYMGEHWLASFALLALVPGEGGTPADPMARNPEGG